LLGNRFNLAVNASQCTLACHKLSHIRQAFGLGIDLELGFIAHKSSGKIALRRHAINSGIIIGEVRYSNYAVLALDPNNKIIYLHI